MGREDNLPPMNADKFFVRSALIGVHRWQIVLRSVFDRLSGKGRLKPVFNLPDESEGSGSLTLLGKAPSVISLTSRGRTPGKARHLHDCLSLVFSFDLGQYGRGAVSLYLSGDFIKTLCFQYGPLRNSPSDCIFSAPRISRRRPQAPGIRRFPALRGCRKVTPINQGRRQSAPGSVVKALSSYRNNRISSRLVRQRITLAAVPVSTARPPVWARNRTFTSNPIAAIDSVRSNSPKFVSTSDRA